MENFKVSIDFSATVSEEAADELEYLVAEFVDGVRNVAANDGGDAPEPVVHTAENCQACKQVDDAMGTLIVKGTNAAFANGTLPYTHLDEGSDAPISACNFNDSY